MFKRVILSLALCASLVSTGFSDVPVDLNPDKDNTLYEDSAGSLSSGAFGELFAGKISSIGGEYLRRGLLHFDVAGSVPSGATITNASLTLQLIRENDFTSRTIDVNRVLQDWGEGTSDPGFGGGGAPATPGDATWIHTFYSGSTWTNPGGDFDNTSSASQVVDTVGSYSWTSGQLIADVQDWLDNPASNFGWILIGNEIDLQTVRAFSSREGTVQPVLSIEYVPEPATLSLLGLGAMALRRRKR